MSDEDQGLRLVCNSTPLPWHAFKGNGVEWRWPHLVVLKAEIREEDLPTVNLWVEVRDRDTGALRTLMFQTAFTKELFSDLPNAERIRKLIRETFLKLCAHEVDELLRNNGTWVDPHDADGGVKQ